MCNPILFYDFRHPTVKEIQKENFKLVKPTMSRDNRKDIPVGIEAGRREAPSEGDRKTTKQLNIQLIAYRYMYVSNWSSKNMIRMG